MSYNKIILLLLVFCVFSCSVKTPSSDIPDPKVIAKINFDLTIFDKDGLYGESTSKRAMDYEFCVPDKETLIQKVKQIDPSLKIHKTAKGRIGCSEKEVLCIGNTHQKDFKPILMELAYLDFIKRIEPTYFE